MLAITFYLICVTGCQRRSELSGTWVVQQPDEVQGIRVPAAMLPRWTLKLKDDGTFTGHIENHIMVTVVGNASGKYTRTGDTLTLTGTRETYRDDGYRRGTDREPLTLKLKYADNALTMLGNQGGDVVFRREGFRAPPKPTPQPRASDPEAVEIVHEMERRYAKLSTYSDEGTLTSSGAGFMAKNARFQTRFIRPHKFRFQAVEIMNGKKWRTNAVWSDGKKSWLYMEDVGGPEERSLGNALSTIFPGSGLETMLVPALLMPDEFGEPTLGASYRELSLAGEERVSGKDCYAIVLSDPDRTDLKLWIDKASYLIVRAFDKGSDATILYRPRRDINIAESEFEFAPTK